MFKKKGKSVVLTILFVTVLLSACGKAKTAESSAPVETAEAETASVPSTAQNEQTSDISSLESPSAPVEYETADGFMSSFLIASDRGLIDTTNDYGVFYRVVYEASLENDELRACGSMDYRNFKGQDSITISSDLTHVFKVDDNTVYMKGTETGDETISREEFAELLDTRKDSGMFFEVEISDGVVKTAYLAAQ